MMTMDLLETGQSKSDFSGDKYDNKNHDNNIIFTNDTEDNTTNNHVRIQYCNDLNRASDYWSWNIAKFDSSANNSMMNMEMTNYITALDSASDADGYNVGKDFISREVLSGRGQGGYRIEQLVNANVSTLYDGSMTAEKNKQDGYDNNNHCRGKF